MVRSVVVGLWTLTALIVWTGLVGAGTLFGWGRAPLASKDDAAAFLSAATEKLAGEAKGNVAFTLIEDGKVAGEYFSSVGEPVDRETLFQVASLSKWISAWGVMTLVDAGRIDLDAPVSRYLTRWSLPPGAFDNDAVTVRRLLSHMAGLSDGLGYAGFAPGDPIQTLEQSLTRAADASPGADGAVKVGAAPGSGWRYSGGGFTLLQLIVEEVSGESFNAYMRRAVLAPLGMTRSTFELPEEGAENVAEFFDTDGSRATHFRFTATAAASLYTSTAELTRFMAAHREGPGGEPAGRGVLRPETLLEMQRPHASRFGAEIWGLGVVLFAPNNAGGFIIGHDGGNAPAINTAARLDPSSGDAVIVLVTGNPRLATVLGGDWVFWRTGNVDLLDVLAASRRALLIFGGGAVLILAAGAMAGFRRRP